MYVLLLAEAALLLTDITEYNHLMMAVIREIHLRINIFLISIFANVSPFNDVGLPPPKVKVTFLGEYEQNWKSANKMEE